MEIRLLLFLGVLPLTLMTGVGAVAWRHSPAVRRWAIARLYGAAALSGGPIREADLLRLKTNWHYVSALVMVAAFAAGMIVTTLIYSSFGLALFFDFLGLVAVYPWWIVLAEQYFNHKVMEARQVMVSLQPRRWRDYLSPVREVPPLVLLGLLFVLSATRYNSLTDTLAYSFLPRLHPVLTLRTSLLSVLFLPLVGLAFYALVTLGMSWSIRARRFLSPLAPSFSEAADRSFRRILLLESCWLRLGGIAMVILAQIGALWPDMPMRLVQVISLLVAAIFAAGVVESEVRGRKT